MSRCAQQRFYTAYVENALRLNTVVDQRVKSTQQRNGRNEMRPLVKRAQALKCVIARLLGGVPYV